MLVGLEFLNTMFLQPCTSFALIRFRSSGEKSCDLLLSMKRYGTELITRNRSLVACRLIVIVPDHAPDVSSVA